MPYIEETCEAGETIEVNKYFTYRIHTKGEKRAKREKPTVDAQKRVNQRKAEKDLRRLMNTNFRDGDLLIRLDFANAREITSSAQMQDKISKALRKMKRKAAADGIELKYIYVKEMGKRGGRHIHLMITRVSTELIRECWPHGGIHIDPLYSGGQYRKIAAYFVKYAAKTEETEGKLIGKRWYGSRNLERPKVTKKIIKSGHFREIVRKVQGYVLEKDTLQSGISDFTGFKYFSYTLIRSTRPYYDRGTSPGN